MKSLITIILAFSLSSFAWVDNADQFQNLPYYQEIADELCWNCGPNEAGYKILHMHSVDETEAETCYYIEFIQNWDDDFGPVNELYKIEACVDSVSSQVSVKYL